VYKNQEIYLDDDATLLAMTDIDSWPVQNSAYQNFLSGTGLDNFSISGTTFCFVSSILLLVQVEEPSMDKEQFGGKSLKTRSSNTRDRI
jgi:uncharacterized protein (AIM24 family)